MMMLVLICLSLTSSIMAQCSYNRDNVRAEWTVDGDQVVIDFENSQIQNFEFTGIAFGQSMYNLEFILFKVIDGQAHVVTGATNDYAPPEIIDRSPVVTVESLEYNDGHLKARVSRPIGSHGSRKFSLEGRIQWNFILIGDMEMVDRGHGVEQIITSHRSLPGKTTVDLQNC